MKGKENFLKYVGRLANGGAFVEREGSIQCAPCVFLVKVDGFFSDQVKAILPDFKGWHVDTQQQVYEFQFHFLDSEDKTSTPGCFMADRERPTLINVLCITTKTPIHIYLKTNLIGLISALQANLATNLTDLASKYCNEQPEVGAIVAGLTPFTVPVSFDKKDKARQEAWLNTLLLGLISVYYVQLSFKDPENCAAFKSELTKLSYIFSPGPSVAPPSLTPYCGLVALLNLATGALLASIVVVALPQLVLAMTAPLYAYLVVAAIATAFALVDAVGIGLVVGLYRDQKNLENQEHLAKNLSDTLRSLAEPTVQEKGQVI